MAEPALGKFIHAMTALAGIEHIGKQHGVVDRCGVDAAFGKDQPVIFHVLADLQDRRVFQHRFQQRQRLFFGKLVFNEPAIEQIAGTFAVKKRYVAGLAGFGGKRNADQFGFHRVERCRFRVNRDKARFQDRFDPFFQRRLVAHAFIRFGIDFRFRPFLRPRLRQIGRGHHCTVLRRRCSVRRGLACAGVQIRPALCLEAFHFDFGGIDLVDLGVGGFRNPPRQ